MADKQQVPISEVKNLRSGVNTKGEVTSIGERRTINLKSGGTIDVCEAILADGLQDENKIPLTLWGDDIGTVKVGSKIEIENGYTNSFKDQVSLTKGKFGTMTVS